MYNVLIFFGLKIMLKSENMGPTFVHPWLSHVLHIQQCHFSLKTNIRMHVTVMKCIQTVSSLIFFKSWKHSSVFFSIFSFDKVDYNFIQYFEKELKHASSYDFFYFAHKILLVKKLSNISWEVWSAPLKWDFPLFFVKFMIFPEIIE